MLYFHIDRIGGLGAFLAVFIRCGYACTLAEIKLTMSFISLCGLRITAGQTFKGIPPPFQLGLLQTSKLDTYRSRADDRVQLGALP